MRLPEVPVRAKVAAVVAWGLLCFVIGHGTRKTIEVEHVRQVEAKAETKVQAAQREAVTAKQEADAAKTQWRTKTVYLPGGTVEVEKEVVREVEKKRETEAAQVVTKTVYQDRVVYKDRDVVRTVTTPGPRWSLGARAGLSLDGRMQYGAEAGRRVLGPLWLTAGADVPNRAALVGLRLEF